MASYEIFSRRLLSNNFVIYISTIFQLTEKNKQEEKHLTDVNMTSPALAVSKRDFKFSRIEKKVKNI